MDRSFKLRESRMIPQWLPITYLEIDEDNSSRAVAFFLMHPIFNEEERMLSMALLIFGRDDDVRTQMMT